MKSTSIQIRPVRVLAAYSGFVALTLLVLASSCTHPPWPPETDQGQAILTRLNLRQSEITSATYRVRWEARGTEPHGQFILRIAYENPGRFHVSGLGPLDIPAFTAVILDEEFWFVDHHNEEFVHDQVGNLDRYNVPLAAFFSTLWRDLFAGGWGGSPEQRLVPAADDRNWYSGADGDWSWRVEWNSGSQAPRRTVVEIAGDDGPTRAETSYKRSRDDFPYWEMAEVELQGFPGGGRHEWTLLDQKYNVSIPSRFFLPLDSSAIKNP